MATTKSVPRELLNQLQADRKKIADELPELQEQGKRLDEAACEDTVTGHMRRAVHQSGRPLQKIAEEVGIDVFALCDFLEGTRNLRSDVLDRLAQAVGAKIRVETAKPLPTSSPPPA